MTTRTLDFAREVGARLEARHRGALHVLGRARHGGRAYPLVLVTSGEGDVPVFVSGGVHGDGPASVYAALQFLERDAAAYARRFRFYVLPCVNPSGFEAETRETAAGVHLGRSFGVGSTAPEVVAVERWLRRDAPHFRVTFDLQEADDPRGTYLSETIAGEQRPLGRRMIADLPLGVDVCARPEVEGDRKEHGVVRNPDADGSLDAYLNGRHTEHSFTTATPGDWALERRVAVHRYYLRAALARIAR